MTVLPADGFSPAAEFTDPSHDQWQSLVEGVLRRSGKDVAGAAAEEALSTSIEDGLTVRPLYTSADASPDPGLPGFAPFTRGSRAAGNTTDGWDVRQRHELADPVRLNEALLGDLENGVTSLWLAVGGPGGVPVQGLARALEGVHLDLAPLVLDAGADPDPAVRELLGLYEARGLAKEAARGGLGVDPLGQAARTGAEPALGTAVDWALLCSRAYLGLRALAVDALPYHDAGGSASEELALSLATGVAYLRELTAAGLSVEEACAQLEFRYAATADQFLTIAKLRAARRLWARVAEVCGAPDAGAQRQHAVTSSVMMTRRDPWVNMLRTTLACLGAGVGGAESVTVLPFDHALGLPDAFARRIARNTSTILMEESHLARVTDPAGGSWYVERLTDELASSAWAFFQEIERAGGQAGALRSGMVQERLAATWAARSEDLARRKEPVTGVSEFPALDERPVERETAPAGPARGGLPTVRRDEAFETLRARSDAHLAATGSRPKVFLAALGPASVHTARASFAANLFLSGGIEPVHEPVSVDASTAAAAFAASGAGIACLCSTEALYAEQADDVTAALRAAGAEQIFLAGRPAEYAGADVHVFAGCDVVAVLSSELDRMGVA
ncbi:methylmalonyl-CoA mutase family protein [Streptomyces sp. ME02-7008A-1]|uniref:methylmalonyl-CoA mutase family protein n=1 Tax=unclassified Streptomyces TaxID=2593676 RepID=UPI0029AB1502|nr:MULTISPECIES: methylmalonyl-CoA mutase family protein [unclassified Streptomyces]MDX3183368.1 methylmalonyl-CoA mutase family protein [Streptomyces sp. ME02-7008A-1]MDX3303820.1 methylmalonyl-CoA mutase family protein [Streptomyces sp. ME02-7008A]